jgi:hypothetical protein
MLTFNVKAGDLVGLFGIFFEWHKSGDAISELDLCVCLDVWANPILGRGRARHRLVAMRQERPINPRGINTKI